MGNIKKDLKEMGCKNVNLIHLAERRDCYQDFVEEVMNFWGFSKEAGNLTECRPTSERLCSIYLFNLYDLIYRNKWLCHEALSGWNMQ
jgi:hypothetical protein